MNLKNVFSLSLLLALPLVAAAQTNAVAPGPPRAGTPIPPRGRAASAPTAPPAVLPAAAARGTAAAPANAAGAIPRPPAPAGTNLVPAPPAPPNALSAAPGDLPEMFHYNWSMPLEQVLDEIYRPARSHALRSIRPTPRAFPKTS